MSSETDTPASPTFEPGLRLCHGPRATQAAVLADLAALLDRASWENLARPVRVLVPSRAVRRHLATALVRRLGRPAVGVAFHTLRGLALEVLTQAGEPPPRGAVLFDLLVPRLARQEADLRRCLDHLEDGYATVAGTVRDLLEAGCEPMHAEAAAELLAALPGGRAARQRALALLRVTSAAFDELERVNAGTSWRLLRRAQELLAAAPDAVLPTRAALVVGFADATGVATDLIGAFLHCGPGRLYLDQPPDPATEEKAAEGAFTARLVERLGGALRLLPEVAEPPARPRLEAFVAAGTEAEVAELARRLQRLLGAGIAPEGILVVARDLERYRLPLSRQLLRLGIPFSAGDTRGALTPAARRAQALLALLDKGPELAVERWLQLVSLPATLPATLAALGVGRLQEFTELEPPPSSRPPRWDPAMLAAAREAAGALCARLAAEPQEATAERYLGWLQDLLAEELGWDAGQPEVDPVLQAVAELRRQLPLKLTLDRAELRLLLTRALASIGGDPLGGQGGGVQVLSVTEARALTAEHLFLLGLNRDLFPRTVREDPLLPDDLRLRLLDILPDVPIKARGFDEERYLFAQLLAAAPRITLSWQVVDDDDRPASPSPLLERLRRSGALPPATRAPALGVRASAGDLDLRRPAFEHTLEAALHDARPALQPLLALALDEARQELAPPSAMPDLDTGARAAALVRVLNELDPDRRTPAGRARSQELGPYFGFVGPAETEALHDRPLSVTLLEGLAACPWQTLLQRVLRMEPPPDPLQTLPGLTPVLVGQVIHGTLEAIARRLLPRPPAGLAALAAHTSTPVPWPPAQELEALLLETARKVLAEAGIRLTGLARALAARARPFLETLRQLEWTSPQPVLGVEVRGELTLEAPAGKQVLTFRADRVDALEAGGLRFTDYKTGNPGITHRTADGRLKAFHRDVTEGRRLQAVAYLLAAQQQDLVAEGRYLFLRPDSEPEFRQLSTAGAEPELIEAFQTTGLRLLQAWDRGTLFPRLVLSGDDEEPRRCASCEVAEACLRRDSGARQRLRRAISRVEEGEVGDVGSAEIEALVGVWRLAGEA